MIDNLRKFLQYEDAARNALAFDQPQCFTGPGNPLAVLCF